MCKMHPQSIKLLGHNKKTSTTFPLFLLYYESSKRLKILPNFQWAQVVWAAERRNGVNSCGCSTHCSNIWWALLASGLLLSLFLSSRCSGAITKTRPQTASPCLTPIIKKTLVLYPEHLNSTQSYQTHYSTMSRLRGTSLIFSTT